MRVNIRLQITTVLNNKQLDLQNATKVDPNRWFGHSIIFDFTMQIILEFPILSGEVFICIWKVMNLPMNQILYVSVVC